MIPLHKVFVDEEECLKRLSEVLSSGWIGEGKVVEEFERVLSSYLNGNLLALNSCTSALQLALHLVKDPQTIVLTTPFTCLATTAAIFHSGMSFRWVDIDPKTANISLDDLKKKLNEKTKIIVVVHVGGNPVDLYKLNKMLDDHEVAFGFRPIVIEDCAQAFGSEYDNKPIGSHGNICCFSFQSVKSLTTGDGGGIILPDFLHYERAKRLRWFGMSRGINQRDWSVYELGFKYHMNDLSAAIGLANLPHQETLLAKQRGNASFYLDELKDVPGLELLDFLGRPSFYSFYIKVKNRRFFENTMKGFGIECRSPHIRNDKNYALRSFSCSLPNMDILEEQLVAIPVGWWLTEEERKYIVNSIKEICNVPS